MCAMKLFELRPGMRFIYEDVDGKRNVYVKIKDIVKDGRPYNVITSDGELAYLRFGLNVTELIDHILAIEPSYPEPNTLWEKYHKLNSCDCGTFTVLNIVSLYNNAVSKLVIFRHKDKTHAMPLDEWMNKMVPFKEVY